jgi:outer membrane protein assembly factor BamB
MKTFFSLLILLFPTLLLSADWLNFRGPQGNGGTSITSITQLSIENKHSWKSELPGRGLSSPILVSGQIFLTSSSGPKQDTLHILCFLQENGNLIWERKFKATGRTICHEKTCIAAPTMVSDGKVVVAQFSSNDIFCLDLKGDLVWLRGLTHDFPNAANGLGMSSSPVISKGVLIAQVENDADSFTTGINLNNGETIWKNERPKGANWTSPVLLGIGPTQKVALQSLKGISIINPSTGEEFWDYQDGASTIPSSTPVQDILLVPSNGLTALKSLPGGNSHTQLWQDNKLGPGTGSPVISGDRILVINKANVLTCAKVETGEILWRMRIKGPASGSPVATTSHLYFFNEDGLGQIIKLTDKEGEVVSTIELEETILCTPALAETALFIRSDKHLWKISQN